MKVQRSSRETKKKTCNPSTRYIHSLHELKHMHYVPTRYNQFGSSFEKLWIDSMRIHNIVTKTRRNNNKIARTSERRPRRKERRKKMCKTEMAQSEKDNDKGSKSIFLFGSDAIHTEPWARKKHTDSNTFLPCYENCVCEQLNSVGLL